MPFNMFPYSNLHNFNLDWILGVVKTMAAAVEKITPAAAGAVRHDVSQSLDAANRRRAAANIHAVSYDPQLISADEQAQARNNIGAASASDIPDVSDVVRYSPQDLTLTQQTRARLNIGATSQDDVTLLLATKHYVKYDEQTLTDAQKAQARTNIGAGSAVDVQTNANEIQTIYGELNNLHPLVVTFSGTTEGGNAACDKTWTDISAAITAGRPLTVRYDVPPAPPDVEHTIYILNAATGSALTGKYLDISDPSNPGNAYTNISCTLLPDNTVRCYFLEV